MFTGSQDQTIRVWGVQKTAPCAHVIRAHDGPVMGLSLHATGDYLLSCSSDAVSSKCTCIYNILGPAYMDWLVSNLLLLLGHAAMRSIRYGLLLQM